MSGKTEKTQPSTSRRLPSRFGLVLLFTALYIIQRFLLKNPVLEGWAAAYPFLYLLVLSIDSLRGRALRPLEVWFAVNATWILVVSRTLYIPPAIILFAVILWSVRRTIWAIWSVSLFILMCVATILVGR